MGTSDKKQRTRLTEFDQHMVKLDGDLYLVRFTDLWRNIH